MWFLMCCHYRCEVVNVHIVITSLYLIFSLNNYIKSFQIKEILDYLLEEEKLQPYDIAVAPRILCHSLETTKARLNELKSINCVPSTLVIVCRSKNEYEKFVRKWKMTNLQFKHNKE